MNREFYIEVSEHSGAYESDVDKLLGRFDLDELDDPMTVGEKVYEIVNSRKRRLKEDRNPDGDDLKVIMLQWPLKMDDIPYSVRRDAEVIITYNGIIVKHREREGGVASEQMVENATMLTPRRVSEIQKALTS